MYAYSIHTVSDQKLDSGKGWERGYRGQLAFLHVHTPLVCVYAIHLSHTFSNVLLKLKKH